MHILYFNIAERDDGTAMCKNHTKEIQGECQHINTDPQKNGRFLRPGDKNEDERVKKPNALLKLACSETILALAEAY